MFRCYFKRKFVLRALLVAFMFWTTFGAMDPARGQFSPGATEARSHDVPSAVTRLGSIETAPVRSPLLRQDLFQVAAPTVYTRDGEYDENRYPVELRAELIEANLKRAVDRLADSEAAEVSISVLNGATILQVTNDDLSRPVNILTITQLDARFNGQSVDELAEDWRDVIEEQLAEVLKARDQLGPQLLRASGIFAGMAGLSAVLLWFHWLLRRRRRTLQYREAEQAAVLLETQDAPPMPRVALERSDESNENGADGWQERLTDLRSRFLDGLDHHLSLKRRLRINRLLRWLVFWLLVLVVYSGAIWITSSVAIWRVGRNWLLGLPIELLLVGFGVSFAIRIGHWLIHSAANSWEDYSFISLGEAKRRALRISTISGVLEDLITILFVGLGIILILNALGVSTASILAGSAVIGFAISFGSQSLVKDFINGCFILLEDQFAEGDVISIGDVGGFVESLNLRITQLRDGEGQLITIPNSAISEVKNLTRSWSRVDFTIAVAYETNPKTVLDLLNAVSTQMYDDLNWRGSMAEPPEVLGIDSVSHEGMLLRVWIKTEPLQQWAVGREFRYRVRVALEEQGIEIGRPQWVSYSAEQPSNANGKIKEIPNPAERSPAES